MTDLLPIHFLPAGGAEVLHHARAEEAAGAGTGAGVLVRRPDHDPRAHVQLGAAVSAFCPPTRVLSSNPGDSAQYKSPANFDEVRPGIAELQKWWVTALVEDDGQHRPVIKIRKR